MSESFPTDNSPITSHPAIFAFRSMHGRQEGQVFALNAAKTVLQFDAAKDGGPKSSTRCLVIQGNDGVTVQTLQGELAINDQVQQEAWMKVDDELTCGNARLRLIRQIESQQIIADDLVHDSRSERESELKDTDSLNPPTNEFFSPFARAESDAEGDVDAPADGSTMCLSPGDLKKLFEPTIYGEEEPDYRDSSLDEPSPKSEPISQIESTLNLIDETCQLCNSETQQSTEERALVVAVDDVPVPSVMESVPDQEPATILDLVPSVQLEKTPPAECDEIWPIFSADAMAAAEMGATDEWFCLNVCLERPQENTEQAPSPMPFANDVHGVMVH